MSSEEKKQKEEIYDLIQKADVNEQAALDQVKVDSMSKLVTEVEIKLGGNETVQKKVLYLTNKQVQLIIKGGESTMQKCVDALELGQPKFVIKLLPSFNVLSQMKIADPELRKNVSADISQEDTLRIETQALLFMKTVIFPLAKETKALIIVSGANDCYLSAKLAQVVSKEQAQLGADCPFTVLAMVAEHEVHYNAFPEDTYTETDKIEDKKLQGPSKKKIAYQVSHNAPQWLRRYGKLAKYYETKLDKLIKIEDKDSKRDARDETVEMQRERLKKQMYSRCDLNPSATRYIVFECLDVEENEKAEDPSGSSQNTSYKTAFEQQILKHITKTIPALVIQGFGTDGGVIRMNEYALQNIPVLVLDSDERAITMSGASINNMSKLAEYANTFQKVDAEFLKGIKLTSGNDISQRGRKNLVNLALEMLERMWKVRIYHGASDLYDSSMYAFFHAALRLGSEKVDLTDDDHELSLYDKVVEMITTNRDNKKTTIPPDLISDVIQFIDSKIPGFFARSRINQMLIDIPVPATSEAPEGKGVQEAKDIAKRKAILNENIVNFSSEFKVEKTKKDHKNPDTSFALLCDSSIRCKKNHRIVRIEDESDETGTCEGRNEKNGCLTKEDKIKVVCCKENHKLKEVTRPIGGWGCDARNEVGGCLCDSRTRGQRRFRCERCDFDYCGPCYFARSGSDASNTKLLWKCTGESYDSSSKGCSIKYCGPCYESKKKLLLLAVDLGPKCPTCYDPENVSILQLSEIKLGEKGKDKDWPCYFEKECKSNDKGMHLHRYSCDKCQKFICLPCFHSKQAKERENYIESALTDSKFGTEFIKLVKAGPRNRKGDVMTLRDDDKFYCQTCDVKEAEIKAINKRASKSSSGFKSNFEAQKSTKQCKNCYYYGVPEKNNYFDPPYVIPSFKKSEWNINPAKFLEYYEAFSNPNIHSGSIHDLDGLKRILRKEAKVDRLPEENDLESLRTLQDAWDHIEIYHQNADRYKLITKVTFLLSIASGILFTYFSLVQSVFGFPSKIPIIVISFASTALVSYISFINPSLRWQKLRVAALSMESNIWVFRTRAGPYRESVDENDKTAENLLTNSIEEIKASVLEGADVRTTSFYGQRVSLNKHGQHQKQDKLIGAAPAGFGRTEELKSKSKKDQTISESTDMEEDAWDDEEEEDEEKGNAAGKKDDNASDAGNAMSRLKAIKLGNPLNILSRSNQSDDDKTKTLFQVYCKRKKIPESQFPVHGIPVSELVEFLKFDPSLDSKGLSKKNNHYEPLTPDLYIQFRLEKQLAINKAKIPYRTFSMNISQILLILASIASGALAYFKLSVWCAGVSIISAAISGHLDFSGVNAKVTRHSSTVDSLQRLILWWQTLESIDRTNTVNIDRLVISGEDILAREQQAMASASQAIKMLEQASQPLNINELKSQANDLASSIKSAVKKRA